MINPFIDPNWCFENPEEAASMIEELTKERDALSVRVEELEKYNLGLATECHELRGIHRGDIVRDLVDAFIQYQHRLDYPMPDPNESVDKPAVRYRNDSTFRRHVDSLVFGVMSIVDNHCRRWYD